MKDIEIYISLQGDKSFDEYISIAKKCEQKKFNRLYLYDDLFYYPSFPILTTIAHHTSEIKLGTCLVNGFYRHPAIIASNYAYLNEVSNGRAILGLGRGAFFDLLKLKSKERFTRKGFEETILFIKHLFEENKLPFKGKIFNTTADATLKITVPENLHIISATWNKNMAFIAGKYTDELQVAEVWTEKYLKVLYNAFIKGKEQNQNKINDIKLSIGGMMCVDNNEKNAIEFAKPTVAVYMPYLQTILKNSGFDIKSAIIQKIFKLSKAGKINEAVKILPDDITKVLALVGTPEQVAEKINNLRQIFPISGLLLSPPYGTSKNIVDNIEYLSENLIPLLK
jgi:5,10-methylenetetrahydromethanopterin reductase